MKTTISLCAFCLAAIAAVICLSSLIATHRALAGNEIEVEVRFDKKLRPWDGFGVNYVETAQTRDYQKWPQEYGGFSTLSKEKREEILDLIFGEDGLKPGVLKMFLDPFHEGMTEASNDNRDPHVIDQSRFDHKTYTQWMRYFVREGLRRARAWGRAELPIVTTLYGPPPWMTKQKFMRGRDLDPAMKAELAEYMIAWVKYLRDEEKFPVKYISLHNEGEDFARWPTDGSWGGYARHDYNAYWHNSQVVEFLKLMRPMLDKQGLKDVGVTPGETSLWSRFINWGYAWAIYQDEEALGNLALVTSHGFGGPADNTGMGIELLQVKKPELRAWTTSMSFGQMDVTFLEMIRQNIYDARVNAVIPWACIQTDTWVGGDPNPGTAFRVDGQGGYTVEQGYYFFKQVSRAGQPGMAVAEVVSQHPEIKLIAFASNGSKHPDALSVINLGAARRDLVIRVSGSGAKTFDAYVTTKKRGYKHDGAFTMRNGTLETTVSGESVVTFFAKGSE